MYETFYIHLKPPGWGNHIKGNHMDFSHHNFVPFHGCFSTAH